MEFIKWEKGIVNQMNTKVGIVSLYHGSQNYGGVLQAYALTRVVNDMGYHAYQIDYDATQNDKSKVSGKKALTLYLKEHSIFQLLQKSMKGTAKRVYAKLYARELHSSFAQRAEVFRMFREEQIQHSETVNHETVGKLCQDTDQFICGSDQIWKPTVIDDVYTLDFGVRAGKNCISYAASLSVKRIDYAQKADYSAWLDQLNCISVREKAAQELLQGLTKNEIQWVCDPVLLLTKQQWCEVATTPPSFGKYLFCYFLGDDRKHRVWARKYAEKHGLKIIALPNLQQKPRWVDAHFGDMQLYDVSPFDFVNLILHAELVMTDSFHATAFSLNMGTPFYVFDRSSIQSMNDRITSLLELTACTDHFISDYKQMKDPSNASYNTAVVTKALDKHRASSMVYLKEALL